MLGYTPFEPHEFAGEVTYWKGITVTRNLGNDTVNVVMELAGDQPLPDEEWEEAGKAELDAYNAAVAAFEAAQAATETTPPRRQRRTAETTTETKAEEAAPPRRQRKPTETQAAGEEAGAPTSTNERALANALDTMFDDED